MKNGNHEIFLGIQDFGQNVMKPRSFQVERFIMQIFRLVS